MSKSSLTSTILQVAGIVVSLMGAPIIGMALIAAGSYQQGTYQKRKARDEYNSSLKDRFSMVATYNAARSRVYGLTRNVDGVLFKGTWGPENEMYTIVVAIAGHEVDGFEAFYFNDVKLDVDPDTHAVLNSPYRMTDARHFASESLTVSVSNSLTLSHSPSGQVIISTSAIDPNTGTNVSVRATSITGKVVSLPTGYAGQTVTVAYTYGTPVSYGYVRAYTGSDTQDLSGELATRFPGLITPEHKFAGIACLIVDLNYSQDVYPAGVPSISALVRGARVYDPRTGVAAWSNNPALCIRDWALYEYGGGCAADEIHAGSIVDAANACDVLNTYIDTTGTFSTRPIFQCNYVAKLDVSPETHLAEMVESMGGKWGWAGGQLKIRAGVYQAPVATIDEDWLSDKASRSIVPEYGLHDMVNTYRVTISDSAQNYALVELPALSPSAYVADDGGELSASLEMGGVTYAPQALHIAGMMLRDQRQGMTISWPCNMRAWPIELFDTINLNCARYGWINKQFEVVGWAHSIESGVKLTLKETGASIYQPDAVFAAVDQIPNTSLPTPFDVIQMTGLAASDSLALQGDASIINLTTVTWDGINIQSVLASGRVEVQYYTTSMPNWQSVTVGGSSGAALIQGLVDGVTYLIRARMVNGIGVRGPWAESIDHTVAGKNSPPSDISNLDADDEAVTWTSIQDVDVAGYVLRWQSGANTEWGSAQPLHSGILTSSPYKWTIRPQGAITLLAKAVDTSGNYSLNPAVVYLTLTGATVRNVVESRPYAPTFDGLITSGTISGGALESPVTTQFFREDARSFFGANADPFFGANTYGAIEYTTAWWAPVTPRDGDLITIDVGQSGAVGLSVEYQIDTGNFFDAPGSNFFLVPGDPFFSAPSINWLPWPGSLVVKGGGQYRWRIRTQSSGAIASVSTLTASLGAPDIEEIVPVTAISSSGTRLTLTNSYRVLNAIVGTLQAGSTAVSVEVQDMSVSPGPLIKALDATRAPVNSSASFVIKGY